MFTLIGLGGIAAAVAFLGLAPKALEIVLILLKAALSGLVVYLETLWKAVKEASYATWTLVLTAGLVGYLWSSGPACTAFYGAANTTPSVTRGTGQSATYTAPEVYQSVKDIFCHWFGCA